MIFIYLPRFTNVRIQGCKKSFNKINAFLKQKRAESTAQFLFGFFKFVSV
jgi:hypothetical protein